MAPNSPSHTHTHPGCSGSPQQLPLSSLALSQPWVAEGSPLGRRGGGAGHKIGGTWQIQPLGEIPDRLPFRKPYMPESTHTKQTHQGGSCTIKGFSALQEGSAHGKLKIGAAAALVSEAPLTNHQGLLAAWSTSHWQRG